MIRLPIVLVLAAVACAPANPSADSTAFSAIDTLKAAPGDTTTPDSAAVTAPTKAAASQAKTAAKTPPKDTTNIGRDRAIPLNAKNPGRTLPTVDTTKKPPR